MTPLQELDQADISILRKAELRDRLDAIRKAFAKQMKENEAAASKVVRMNDLDYDLTLIHPTRPSTISLISSKRTLAQKATSLS